MANVPAGKLGTIRIGWVLAVIFAYLGLLSNICAGKNNFHPHTDACVCVWYPSIYFVVPWVHQQIFHTRPGFLKWFNDGRGEGVCVTKFRISLIIKVEIWKFPFWASQLFWRGSFEKRLGRGSASWNFHFSITDSCNMGFKHPEK